MPVGTLSPGYFTDWLRAGWLVVGSFSAVMV